MGRKYKNIIKSDQELIGSDVNYFNIKNIVEN